MYGYKCTFRGNTREPIWPFLFQKFSLTPRNSLTTLLFIGCFNEKSLKQKFLFVFGMNFRYEIEFFEYLKYKLDFY